MVFRCLCKVFYFSKLSYSVNTLRLQIYKLAYSFFVKFNCYHYFVKILITCHPRNPRSEITFNVFVIPLVIKITTILDCCRPARSFAGRLFQSDYLISSLQWLSLPQKSWLSLKIHFRKPWKFNLLNATTIQNTTNYTSFFLSPVF